MPLNGFADVIGVLQRGIDNRATAATNMNGDSSRSHAVLTLTIEVHKSSGKVMTSKLILVDLAGSERAKKSGAEDERLREAIAINEGAIAPTSTCRAPPACSRRAAAPVTPPPAPPSLAAVPFTECALVRVAVAVVNPDSIEPGQALQVYPHPNHPHAAQGCSRSGTC